MEAQKAICKKYSSDLIPINEQLFIGLGTDLEFTPINGLRHPKHETMNGWYIWSEEWSDSTDFFKPIHAEHLIEMQPAILKYLSLDIGFRFQIDDKGYENVWFDEKITRLE
ncbi:immunity protein Imm33 domain-containing protein [Maribacter aquivivus]